MVPPLLHVGITRVTGVLSAVMARILRKRATQKRVDFLVTLWCPFGIPLPPYVGCALASAVLCPYSPLSACAGTLCRMESALHLRGKGRVAIVTDFKTYLVVSEHVALEKLVDRAILIMPDAGHYHSLSETGLRTWETMGDVCVAARRPRTGRIRAARSRESGASLLPHGIGLYHGRCGLADARPFPVRPLCWRLAQRWKRVEQ